MAQFDEQPFDEQPLEQPSALEQAGQALAPEGSVGQYVSGGKYDPMSALKRTIVSPDQGVAPVFGKTMDDSMKALMDFVLPGSSIEAGAQLAAGWLGGKVMPYIAETASRAFRSLRPIAKEVAKEQLAGQLITPEAYQAKAFYEAADNSGKTVMAKTKIGTGKRTYEIEYPQNFGEAQKSLKNLEYAANELERGGRVPEARLARENMKELEARIEKAFPGYTEAQKGYAKLKDIGAVQELVNENAPLKALELDLAAGRVEGPSGATLLKGGGRATKFLQPSELKEVRQILNKLGPEPGDSLFQKLAMGRAAAGAVGGLMGFQHGGYVGGAEGMAAGVIAPSAINWMISQMLRHPTTRAFLKSGLERKGGLANLQFWQLAGMLGQRLGMNMVPPEEEPQAPTMPIPMPAPMPGMEGQQ